MSVNVLNDGNSSDYSCAWVQVTGAPVSILLFNDLYAYKKIIIYKIYFHYITTCRSLRFYFYYLKL